MTERLLKLGALLGALILPAGGVWWMASHVAFADDQAEEQGEMKTAVKLLTDFRVADETAKRAERETIRRLCDAGKLKGADCEDLDR